MNAAEKNSDSLLPRFGTAVILAGGQSRRMGFDKQNLMVLRENIVRKSIREMSQTFPDIIVVTNTPEKYRGLPVRVAADRFKDCGPLAGLEVGLAEAQSDYVFLRACDMPLYHDGYVRHMMACLKKEAALIATTEIKGQIEPFNSFYHRALLKEVQDQLKTGRRTFRAVMDRHVLCCIPEAVARRFDPTLSHFVNLNTKEDYHDFIKQGMP